MPSYFSERRNVELSLLYHLDTQLSADWSGTTVAKTFKQVYAKDVDLPIVLVRLDDTNAVPKEMGSTEVLDYHLIIVDIFCRSDAQRLDMSSYIRSKIQTGWVHYDHSHPVGDNSTLSRAANGRDMVRQFVTDSKVAFGETVDEKDKYRHVISVRVKAN